MSTNSSVKKLPTPTRKEEALKKSQAANSIKTILTYNWYGAWVFDDEAVDLHREPFVAGADTLISRMADGSDKVILIFADVQFPGYDLEVGLVETIGDGTGGSTYYCKELDHELWLCPALLKYFEKPPQRIWVKFKPVK